MLKKIVHRLLEPRHYWRKAGFDELSEVYLATMFRGISLSLMGLFVPIFMLRLDYTLTSIMMVFGFYFTFRLITDVLAGYTVARIGPKHTLLIGFGLQIASSSLFLTLKEGAWPIWLLGLLWGTSASYYFVPFYVDFSKIKHSESGGKEVGYVNAMEKTGAAIGPLFGGFLASWFGGKYTFLVAVILLIIGAFTLMSSAEPVKTHQKLEFRKLPIKKVRKDFIPYAALGVEYTLCIMLWPLYLGSFILLSSSAYARLGVLTAVSVTISVLAAKTLGELIDRRKGRLLLQTGTMINGVIHLARPLVTSYTGALAAGVANEAATAAYRMPFLKGMFDAADDLPGFRIAYFTVMEVVASAAKAVAWWVLVLVSLHQSVRSTIICGFVIASVASCLIMTERFKALDNRTTLKP